MADALIDRRRHPLPGPELLGSCKLVAHRGQHDNRVCMENTLGAFKRAVEAGVWGIELDIRWTKDLHPVVFHDADLARLYGSHSRIDQYRLSDLRQRHPDIPTLAEVVAHFGKSVHLMIEIKKAPWKHRTRQIGNIQDCLGAIDPGEDYHLMSMQPEMLLPFSGLPKKTLVAISDHFPKRLSEWALDHEWGGLCGHFLLLHNAMAHRHHAKHQSVGTGFADSRQCLYRELNRGIDWIFSNDAVGLQAMVDETIRRVK